VANTIASLLVKLGLDGKKFDKGIKRAIRGMDELARRAEKLSTLSKIAGFATLGASAVALTAALGPASAALLALPAAAAIAGAALAVLSAGLAGMGDAMAAVASGDAAALEEALQGLAPSAQQFVRSWAGLREQFTPIQQAVQQRLFAGLGEELTALGGGIMPTLERGMTRVADSLNSLATEAMTAMNTPLFKGALADTFDGTAAATESFGGLLGPLLTLLLQLSAAGLPLVTRFTEWATGATEAATAFLGTEAGAARLSEIVTSAGDILAQLGTIVGNLAMGLGSLFGAASGGGQGLLDTIEQLTERFRAWATSTQGQEAIGQLFDVLSAAGEQLLATMPQILSVIGTLLGLFQSLPGPVQENAAAIIAWAVILGPVVGKLTALVGIVKGIAPAVKAIGGPLGKVAMAMGKLGVQALIMGARMLAGWLMGMGPIGWIIMAVIALVALIILYWDQIVAAITVAWEWVRAATVTAWNAIKEFLAGLWASILAGLTAAWEWIKNAISTAWNWVVNLFMTYHPVGIIISHWEQIKAFTAAAWSWIKAKVSALWNGLVAFLSNGVNKVKTFLSNGFNAAKNFVVNAVTGMHRRVVATVAALISFVRGIPGRIKSALGNLGSLLVSAGRNIIQGLINGVTGMIGSLRSKFSEITNMIPNWKGPMRVDMRLLEPTGAAIMGGLSRGIEGSLPALRSTLGDVTKAIPSNVSASVRHTGGREDRLVLDVTGADEQWKKLVRRMVRAEGRGDVQLAFGTR
jgi:phage-related protein